MLRVVTLVASMLYVTARSALFAAEPVIIDGSSTVYPISLAGAERVNEHNGALYEISVSGTTGGMRLFTTGKISITAASRPIRPDEIRACASAGIDFLEIPVALDGVTVAVSAHNTFIDHFTVGELKLLWQPDSAVRTWADLRKGWPTTKAALYGPGGNSGTFDFFTEVIVGKSRAIREDFTGSEDDNELVQGLVGNPNALAYFGWSYFKQNSTLLRAIPVDSGHGPVPPTREAIINGTYAPLSRPLFYYVELEAYTHRPEISAFIDTILDNPGLVDDAGYVSLSLELRTAIHARLVKHTTGSVFADHEGHPRLSEIYLAGGAPVVSAPVANAAPVVKATSVVAAAAAVPVAAAAVRPQVPVAVPVPVPVTAAVPVAPVPLAKEPAASAIPPASAEVQRLRAAALALARATLERIPDPIELRKRQQELQAALLPVTGAQP